MAESIHNPHDKVFKHLLGERDTAASFLRSNLPEQVARHLDFDTLEVVQASFIDAQYAQSEADLLMSVNIAGRAGFVYVLLEHQSTPEYLMVLRLLSYMVRVWRRYIRESPREGLLPVIIPLVLFHGPKGWEGPLDFKSAVDIPADDLTPYTPDFHIGLFDLSGPSGEALAGSALVRILADILGALGKPDTTRRIARAFRTLNELAEAPNFLRYFEILFRYVLDVYDIPKEDLMEMVTESIEKDVREAAMTTYEQIKQEGRVETGAAILARQIARRFHVDPESFLPLLGGLELFQYEELSEKILEAESEEEIREWLEAVRRN